MIYSRTLLVVTVTVIYILAVGCAILALSVRQQQTGSHLRDLEQVQYTAQSFFSVYYLCSIQIQLTMYQIKTL